MTYKQIFEDTNEYGNLQTYLIDLRCEKIAICKECELPYTNTGNGLICIDCLGGEEFINPKDEYIEKTNQYGYPQMYFVDEKGEYPVCASCKCLVMSNRGNGMLCDSCNYEIIAHMDYDYE